MDCMVVEFLTQHTGTTTQNFTPSSNLEVLIGFGFVHARNEQAHERTLRTGR